MKKQHQILKWQNEAANSNLFMMKKAEIYCWMILTILSLIFSVSLQAQVVSPPMFGANSGGGWNVNGNRVTISDYNSVTALRTGINQLHRNEEAFFKLCPNSIADIYMPSQAVWDSWNPDKKALHIVNEERRARGGIIYPSTGFGEPRGPVNGYPYSGVPKVVDDSAEWWVDWLRNNNLGIQHCNDNAPANRRCPSLRIKDFGGNCLTPHGGLEGMASNHRMDDASIAISGILSFTYGETGHRSGVLSQKYKDDFGAPREEGYVGFGTGLTSPNIGYKSMLAFKMGDTPSDEHIRANGNCRYNWLAKTSDMPGCTRYLAAVETAYQEITAGGSYNVRFESSSCFQSMVSTVRIRMSVDGGTTFPSNLILADNIPSSRTAATVNVPNGINVSNIVMKIESANASCVYFSDEVVRRVPYCASTYTGAVWQSMSIKNFTLKDAQNRTVFTNPKNALVGYEDFTNDAPINVAAGVTLNYTLETTERYTKDIWIDQNRNGVFEISERIHAASGNTGTISIPSSLANGTYRMRVRVAGNYNNSTYSNNPCKNDKWGQIEDYGLVIGTTAVGGNNAFFVNVGGPAYTDDRGRKFMADNLGNAGRTATSQSAIAGTVNDPLYQSNRYGNMQLDFPVANGTYQICLLYTSPSPRDATLSRMPSSA